MKCRTLSGVYVGPDTFDPIHCFSLKLRSNKQAANAKPFTSPVWVYRLNSPKAIVSGLVNVKHVLIRL